jgi:hypothetical protein
MAAYSSFSCNENKVPRAVGAEKGFMILLIIDCFSFALISIIDNEISIK